MKKSIIITFLSLFLVPCSLVFGQREASDVRKGNKQYNKQDYSAAEISYRRALDTNKESYAAQYNLGEALFKQDKYPEALAAYESAARMLDKNKDKEQMAKVMHNIGNCQFAQQQYDKAVAAFQESLRANPKDNDTRYNLVKAMENRHIMYNDTIDYIIDREKQGDILVIRPDEALKVGRAEKDPEKLKAVYEIGRKIAKERLSEIKFFLEKA